MRIIKDKMSMNKSSIENVSIINLRKINKKGAGLLQKVTIHIVLVGLIFAMFMFSVGGMISGRDVKQQVLEKQLALLVEAARPGFSFEVMQKNIRGTVDDVRVEDGRVFVDVDGFPSIEGYPYFSKYKVNVEKGDGKFIVSVAE